MAKHPYRRERSSAIELRSYPLEMKRRADGEEKASTLEGYAAVFNRETVLVPADAWYKGSPEIREKIERGAFKRSLTQSDQRAVWNHNTDVVLGRRKNGTLERSEDEHGLRTVITPPDTDLIRDMVMSPIERGDVDQMSFGFRILDEAVLETKGLITITLRELDLIEVSPVAIPAYTDTEIALSARSSDRIEEFRARYTSESSVQHGHASEDAPVDMCHLDEELRLQWERELEDMAA